MPHTLEIYSYKKPTFCDHCEGFLRGLTKQGVKCCVCGLDFHEKCANETLCHPTLTESRRDDENARSPFKSFKSLLNSFRPQESYTPTTCSSQTNDGQNVSIPHSFQIHTYTFPTNCQYCGNLLLGLMKQGYQCKDCKYNVHMKCLDKAPRNCIGEAQNDLSQSAGGRFTSGFTDMFASNAGKDSHSLNINNNHSHSLLAKDIDSRSIESNIPLIRIFQSVKFTKNGRRGVNDCSSACETTVSSSTSNDDNTQGALYDYLELSQPNNILSVKEKCIGNDYAYFPEELLGSGQFGRVHGGRHILTNQSFAIKIIDKRRFPKEQEDQLKNEKKILENISHPGIVRVAHFFEDYDCLYVVMEKLEGDMLDFITSHHDEERGISGRLTERMTRFLIHQILVALSHLHKKNIVHCDLKPENVLLATGTKFPHAKLCDFGFARVIGETTFRRSVVGTPAYLAPEVLENKNYNRTLDMWSVGVIIYVSLSGTFPFNEDAPIPEQIKNASFMYPSDPWDEISTDAKNLIQNLLQVDGRDRLTVGRSLIHPWLNDYETWCDLRELEHSVKQRWLTHESDDERWKNYCISNKLRPPAIPDPFGETSRLYND